MPLELLSISLLFTQSPYGPLSLPSDIENFALLTVRRFRAGKANSMQENCTTRKFHIHCRAIPGAMYPHIRYTMLRCYRYSLIEQLSVVVMAACKI